MKRVGRLSVALLCSLLVASACGGSSNDGASKGPKKKLKVAFVYVGGTHDAGWTKKHDDGRKSLEAALGSRVEVTIRENVAEGASSALIFEDFGKARYDLVFAASFGYGDQMLAAANAYPNTCYQHATGYKTAANMGTYFGAAEEARYLSGIAAGRATRKNKIGYVAAFPIPEVIRGINAFTLGVRSVAPNATVEVAWTATWFDPRVERQMADDLLVRGADVLTQHQDTPATGQAAEAREAKWVGYNDDMASFAPVAWLTAPVWDWGPYYIRTAEAVMAGRCPNGQYYGTMADGMVKLAPFGQSVDKTTQDLVNLKASEIKAGSLKPFTGPIKDQDGRIRVSGGVVETLENLLAMDYLVDGVIGTIPKRSG